MQLVRAAMWGEWLLLKITVLMMP